MQLSGYLQRFDKNQLQNFTSGLGAPIVLLAIMGMVILPMPPFLLDVLFSFNIALSLVIILVAVLTQRPVDFGIFPLVLLIATVLRLALNVALLALSYFTDMKAAMQQVKLSKPSVRS